MILSCYHTAIMLSRYHAIMPSMDGIMRPVLLRPNGEDWTGFRPSIRERRRVVRFGGWKGWKGVERIQRIQRVQRVQATRHHSVGKGTRRRSAEGAQRECRRSRWNGNKTGPSCARVSVAVAEMKGYRSGIANAQRLNGSTAEGSDRAHITYRLPTKARSESPRDGMTNMSNDEKKSSSEMPDSRAGRG